jgi:hypothetical protein
MSGGMGLALRRWCHGPRSSETPATTLHTRMTVAGRFGTSRSAWRPSGSAGRPHGEQICRRAQDASRAALGRGDDLLSFRASSIHL